MDPMLFTLSLGLNLLLIAAALFLARRVKRLKRKVTMYRTHETFQESLIKVVEPELFDPRFAIGKTGPMPSSAITFVPAHRVLGSIDDFESWIICNLAKTSHRIFEFGTCTGKTAFLMAANAPADAKITTLTLGPEQLKAYQSKAGDETTDQSSALEESAFSTFFYSGTGEEKKIDQLLMDSKSLDADKLAQQFDLIFVDGSHAKSYVESDSEKALKMVKPGGIVLWHDYRGPDRTQGVFLSLNDLNKTLPLVHIKGTCLVAYRKPTHS